jgi:hypothetical protein
VGLNLTSHSIKELYIVVDSKPPADRMPVQVIEIKGIACRAMLIDQPVGTRCVGKLQGREPGSSLEYLLSASKMGLKR